MAADPSDQIHSDRIEKLRTYRVRPGRARDLSADFAFQAAALTRTHKRLGAISRAWAACCPNELLTRSAIVSLNRGVLTVSADDSPTRFELDRWLRQSGQDELIDTARTTLRKVKIIVAGRPSDSH